MNRKTSNSRPHSGRLYQTAAALVLALGLIACLFGREPAAASALNDFNLIVLGDLRGSSNVEGRVVVFGDITGNAKDIATRSQAVTDPVDTQGLNQTDTLVVGGQIKGTVQVNNGGVRTYGSATGAHINNADYVTHNDASVTGLLSTVRVDIDNTLSLLNSLTTDSYVDLSVSNKAIFNSTPGDDNIAVFDIDASFFNRNGQPDLTGALDADLIVIRVSSGASFSINGGFNMGNEFLQDEYQSKIIWYMPDVTDLTIHRLMGGAVIAPNANLKFTSALEGTVIARNVTMNAQVHLPSLDSPALDTPPAAQVPEPSSLLLMGLGLLALAVIRHRPRRSGRQKGQAFFFRNGPVPARGLTPTH